MIPPSISELLFIRSALRNELRQFVCLAGAAVTGSSGIRKVVFFGFSFLFFNEKSTFIMKSKKFTLAMKR